MKLQGHFASIILALAFLTFYTQNSDGVTVPISTFSQLRAALRRSSDTLVIQKDIDIVGELPQITTSLTIRSSTIKCRSRCRLRARKNFRHFKVGKGGSLFLRGLELRSGETNDGGGSVSVVNGGVLRVRGCLFRFNRVNGLLEGGGVISVKSGSRLRVESSIFSRNVAGFGGAIDVLGNSFANISYSIFSKNWGKVVGGAISFADSSDGVLFKNRYSQNYANIGGVSYVKDSTVAFCSNNYMNKNQAGLKGPHNYIVSSSVTRCNDWNRFFTLESSKMRWSCSACRA